MSLRLRLVVLVGTLVLLLLGGLGFYLMSSLEPWAREALDHELDLQAEAIEDHLEVKRSGQLEQEDDDHFDHVGFVILDARGEVAMGRGLDRVWPLFTEWGRPQTLEGTDGRSWRVYGRLIHPEHEERLDPSRRPLRLIVGTPARPFDQVSSRFQLGLAVSLMLGLFLGGAGAAVIAQVSSAPIRRLSVEVGGIEVTSIERRIHTSGLDPELAQLAGSVNGLLERLDGAFQQQRALISHASHALRTPVASLLTISEVNLRRERSTDEYRRALVEIGQVAKDANQMVEQILALGRIDRLQAGLQKSAVPLAELGEEMGRLFGPRALEAGLELQVDLPRTLALAADPTRLRELLEVLLDNALRYTPRGGQLGLDASSEGRQVVLRVWDTGPGIAAEERERVFERFYRGAVGKESGQPGSGLGLSIARAIALAHGAELLIQDRPGGGTQVILKFPPPSL
ncbi:MAG: hypothetical protein IPG45_09805 [Deltaproteobacteria bacterium]|nr:hypothetical protein [Deltaproteobacteria bacterium]